MPLILIKEYLELTIKIELVLLWISKRKESKLSFSQSMTDMGVIFAVTILRTTFTNYLLTTITFPLSQKKHLFRLFSKLKTFFLKKWKSIEINKEILIKVVHVQLFLFLLRILVMWLMLVIQELLWVQREGKWHST